MRRTAGWLLLLVTLWGCSNTVLVPVPPRMELKEYGTLGVTEFLELHPRRQRTGDARASVAHPCGTAGDAPGGAGQPRGLACHGRQPPARPEALEKIGAKYGVDAIFVGEITYSEPKTNININSTSKLEGSARTDVRGDISARLVETRTGAAVWSSSAWATRQVGRVDVSGYQGREHDNAQFGCPRRHGADARLPPHRGLPAKHGAPEGEIAARPLEHPAANGAIRGTLYALTIGLAAAVWLVPWLLLGRKEAPLLLLPVSIPPMIAAAGYAGRAEARLALAAVAHPRSVRHPPRVAGLRQSPSVGDNRLCDPRNTDDGGRFDRRVARKTQGTPPGLGRAMIIRGGCHCGNIRFSLSWEPDPAEIPARACICSFCTKHGGVWTSNPRASSTWRSRIPSA